MLGNARGTEARGVMSSDPCYHTSPSRAARVAQHEDDRGRVNVGLPFAVCRLQSAVLTGTFSS